MARPKLDEMVRRLREEMDADRERASGDTAS